MAIKHLLINNFRNHSKLELKNLSSEVFIVGDNGSGKTNILEALSLLSIGNGFRKVKLADLLIYSSANKDIANSYSIQWSCHFSLCNDSFAVSCEKGEVRDRKLVKRNGDFFKPQKALSGMIKVVWFLPQMCSLFYGSVEERRSFLDRLTFNFYPSHADALSNYKKVLRSRNQILKSENYDDLWLDSIEHQMVEYGAQVICARAQMIDELNAFIEQTDWPKKPRLSFVEKNFYNTDKFDKALYLNALKASRSKDIMLGRTSIGPHRDDFEVLYIQKGVNAKHCSTGEQKNLIIKIILAQLSMLGEKFSDVPIILLLDDLYAHIDSENKMLLTGEMQKLTNIQKWITGTHDDFRFLESVSQEEISVIDLNKIRDAKAV